MINKAILVGNLGADPEIRYTQSGTQVATFNIATTEKFKGQDGKVQEHTEWHKIVAWKRLAEICGEYLSKGSRVYIEGKIQTRKWQDQNGHDRYSTEIIARELKMLSPRQQAGGSQGTGGQSGGGQGGGYFGGGQHYDDGYGEPPPGFMGTGDDVPF